MKITLETLDAPIKSIDNHETCDPSGALLTFRKALVAVCGAYQPFAANDSQFAAGSEAVQAFSIGKKIYEAQEDLDLHEQDVALLKKIILNNRVFFAFVTARLLEILDEKNGG